MIDRLTRIDIAILVAAAVLALGTFCPLVSLPVLASISYMKASSSDGFVIVACSAGIGILVVSGYRRSSAIFSAAALIMIVVALARFATGLSEAKHAFLKPSSGPDPFRGLTELLAKSVGFEWGWVLLFLGAFGALVLALLPPSESVPFEVKSTKSDDERAFSSADQIIADYLENRKISPAIRNRSTAQQPGFGKRRSV